jgi:hypothetical protein
MAGVENSRRICVMSGVIRSDTTGMITHSYACKQIQSLKIVLLLEPTNGSILI